MRQTSALSFRDAAVMDDERVSPRTYAKALRRRMTRAEVILWSRLRRDAIAGRRFRRQHPIGPYIADFACLPVRLVIEVDGATHGSEDEIKKDRRRDA
jgi:very-short-patch-repair endonuclease